MNTSEHFPEAEEPQKKEKKKSSRKSKKRRSSRKKKSEPIGSTKERMVAPVLLVLTAVASLIVWFLGSL